ncbi:MAG: hypothetical protein AAF717_15415 [Bacteroidota bacterium]
MFSKSNVLATLAATIVLFLLGFLIWGVVMDDFFEQHAIGDSVKEHPDFTFIVLGNLFSAFAICTLYGQWARGSHSAKQGAEFGIWIGVFVGLGLWFVQYATTTIMSLTGYLVDAVLQMVYYAITGMVIALVYKASS